MTRKLAPLGVALLAGFLLGVLATVAYWKGVDVAPRPVLVVPVSQANEHVMSEDELREVVVAWERHWFREEAMSAVRENKDVRETPFFASDE